MDVFVASFYDQKIAILHSCVEVNALVVEMLTQILYQNVGFLCLQTAARVILQEVAFKTYEIAAQSQIVVGKLHTNAGSLQRTASFIHQVLVVAKDAAVGNLTTRMKAIGHSLKHSTTTIASKKVEMWSIGILQEGLASQCLNRPICHSVG